jgi:hypothetical protein
MGRLLRCLLILAFGACTSPLREMGPANDVRATLNSVCLSSDAGTTCFFDQDLRQPVFTVGHQVGRVVELSTGVFCYLEEGALICSPNMGASFSVLQKAGPLREVCIAGLHNRLCAITETGDAVCNDNDFVPPSNPEDPFTSLPCNPLSSRVICAIRSSGAYTCWDDDGLLFGPDELVVDVYAGYLPCVLTRSGFIQCSVYEPLDKIRWPQDVPADRMSYHANKLCWSEIESVDSIFCTADTGWQASYYFKMDPKWEWIQPIGDGLCGFDSSQNVYCGDLYETAELVDF